MISSVSQDPEGTQHVADGPAPATETQFVPDGPAATQFVPDGPAKPTPKGDETQHVADLPRFGRYRALAQLGAGAMGIVYRAQDDVLGRSVAIKALNTRDTSTRERFLREARAIGAVLHPNILAVYDAGTDDNTPYLVMELAANGTLRDRIAHGPLPIEAVRQVGIQIARALAAAHAANIVHRDVKPANILAAGDVWKLADFGIARLPDSTLTVEGQFLGSPSYAAPESLRAAQFSPASDIYGLGATLYEALAGAPPHGDHDMQSVVRKLEQDPPLLSMRREVPAALEDAIMATLARDPAQRPSADELAHLLAITDGAPRKASQRASGLRPQTSGGPQSSGATSPRTKLVAIVLAAIAIVLVVVAITRDKQRGASRDVLDPRGQFAKPPQAKSTQPRASTEEPIDPSQPEPPEAPEAPKMWDDTTGQPQVLDQYGNPVDEETAKKILEQMQREAEEEYERLGRGRGRGKKKHRGD